MSIVTGIWDVLTNQDAVNFVSSRIAAGLDLPGVCEAIMEECLSTSGMMSLGCDNMTIVIVALLKGAPLTAWASRVKARYESTLPSPGESDGGTESLSPTTRPSTRRPTTEDINGGEGVN
jgi:hypothetical protein